MDWARTFWKSMAVGLSLATGGCDENKDAQPAASVALKAQDAPRPASDQRNVVNAGDSVLVERGTVDFSAGKVLRVDGDKVTYECTSNRSTGETTKEKVYVLAPEHRTAARPNDVAVCKTGPTSWNPCTVTRVEQAIYVVNDPWGKPHNLSASDIVWPNEAARARIEKKLDMASRQMDFVNAAMAAGLPQRPEGWNPRPGDEIVAKYSDASWQGGRIRRLTPTQVHVVWDDKSNPSERSHDEVTPKPEKSYEVRERQYVLGRPRRGTHWDYYRVERVDDNAAVLVDKDGRTRTVNKNDVIPLGKPKKPE